ncbi:MAG: hypothetical protein JSS91_01385 [Bacteroidetes bacterium]|nr:hypothetical protein [Bacteroidota bacterium]
MKQQKNRVLNFFNIVLLVVAAIQYYLLTPLNTYSEKYINPVMDLDYKIKLIPGFLIFYMSVYLLLGMIIIFIVKSRESSDMTIFLLASIFLWSLVNFLHGFFPTLNVLRPKVDSPGFFFEAVNALYNNVDKFNTIPNWHVATAILLTITYYKNKFKRPLIIVVWTVLIALSTLFLKMAYIMDVVIAIPLPFLCYFLAEKISTVKLRTESIQEIVKTFSLESLVQSVAIGIRDEATLSSLIEGLTRIEKSLSDADKSEVNKILMEFDPPVPSLKQVINNLIESISSEKHLQKAQEMFGDGKKSYAPTDTELKRAIDDMVAFACRPFDNSKFRYEILELKKKNTGKINTTSIEELAKDRSSDIIFRFRSFVESHKKDITLISKLSGAESGIGELNFDDIKLFSKELRKPPYEISPDEVWGAFFRIEPDKVKPLSEKNNPANVIALTQYAIGKIDTLVPFSEMFESKYKNWLTKNESEGKKFSGEQIEWLDMMKNYVSTFLKIDMMSFNDPPFINKGGAARAYNLFGTDLNKVLTELNELLVS